MTGVFTICVQAKTKTGGKLPPGRSAVKCVKRKPNKSGGPDRVDLLVMIDLVGKLYYVPKKVKKSLFQTVYKLAEKQLAEYKEVFMLFDKDQDGVLSFTELGTAMKTLGQRPSGNSYLLFLELCAESANSFL